MPHGAFTPHVPKTIFCIAVLARQFKRSTQSHANVLHGALTCCGPVCRTIWSTASPRRRSSGPVWQLGASQSWSRLVAMPSTSTPPSSCPTYPDSLPGALQPPQLLNAATNHPSDPVSRCTESVPSYSCKDSMTWLSVCCRRQFVVSAACVAAACFHLAR